MSEVPLYRLRRGNICLRAPPRGQQSLLSLEEGGAGRSDVLLVIDKTFLVPSTSLLGTDNNFPAPSTGYREILDGKEKFLSVPNHRHDVQCTSNKSMNGVPFQRGRAGGT